MIHVDSASGEEALQVELRSTTGGPLVNFRFSYRNDHVGQVNLSVEAAAELARRILAGVGVFPTEQPDVTGEL